MLEITSKREPFLSDFCANSLFTVSNQFCTILEYEPREVGRAIVILVSKSQTRGFSLNWCQTS